MFEKAGVTLKMHKFRLFSKRGYYLVYKILAGKMAMALQPTTYIDPTPFTDHDTKLR